MKTQIDHMMYDNSITRDSNTTLHNFTKINEIIDVLNELTVPATAKEEEKKTNAELLVEVFKDIVTKYSEEDIDNAMALLKAETETANEILHKIHTEG